MGSIAPRAVDRVEHSEGLLRVLRQRMVELQFTFEVIDHLSGFHQGYAAKLLANPPQKRLGHFSLFLLLQTLALDLLLVENPERLQALKNPLHLRRRKIVLRAPRSVILTEDYLRLIGSKGGFARAKKLSEKRRSRIAKRANRIRWARVRASAAEAPQSAPASV
jgi:hypothetical protein